MVPASLPIPLAVFAQAVFVLAPLASGQEQDPPVVEVPPALDLPAAGDADPAQDPPQEPDQAGEADGLAAGWAYALERDARAGFLDRGGSALAGLQPGPGQLPPEERPAALMALGAGRVLEGRVDLEAWASEGLGNDRLAAILALGELGDRLGEADLLLLDLLRHPEPIVGECALLALLRSGQAGWRELAAGIAGDPEHALHGSARALLAFHDDPRSAIPPHPAVLHLLDWRWKAARSFGTVDGKAWGIAILERLGNNNRFLDEVVLHAVTDVHLAGVKDHVLQLLLEPGSPARVRAAVRVMPHELDQLVQAGLWSPRNPNEWRALIDEAFSAGVTALLPNVIEAAIGQREVAPAAAALSVRRDERYEAMVLAALDGEDAQLRVLACRGAGESGLDRFVRPLQKLDEDPVAPVRAAALAARLRLGDLTAQQELRELFLDEAASSDQRAHQRDALAQAGRSVDVTAFLAALAASLEGIDRADLLAICALRGRLIEGGELRDAYALCLPSSSTALRLVEALSLLPTSDDLDFLADQFPIEEPMALNAALARALIRGGHKKVEPLLRAAVWSGPFDRSVLAAVVVKQTSGLRTLQHWVLQPPSEATSADIRRVGFAIGEWGGIAAIQDLQERIGGIAGADRPALQGAFLGAMSARTH